MANYQAAENAKISVTSTDSAATFGGQVNQVYISCDADCFISFDQPAVLNQSLLIKANLAPVRFTFEEGGSVGQVHAITSSTANLYILAIRS